MDNPRLGGKVEPGEKENIHEETSMAELHPQVKHIKILFETAKPSDLLRLFLEGAAGSRAQHEKPIGNSTGKQGRGILGVKPDTLLSRKCSQEAEECEAATDTSTHVRAEQPQ